MVIYLYYPSKTLGGAELLLLRVGQWLGQKGWTIRVLDESGGFLAANAKNYGLEWVPVKGVGAIDQGVLLAPASELFSLHKLGVLGKDVKVFFWVIHPFNLFPTYPLLGRILLQRPKTRKWLYEWILKHELRRLRGFYAAAQCNHAIAFMDGACLGYNANYLSEGWTPEFLPIPVSQSNGLPRSAVAFPFDDRTPLKFGWVGRIDRRMKLPVLKIILRDLNQYAVASRKFFHMTLIGEGDGLAELRKMAEELIYLKCEFVGSVQHGSLQEYLLRNVDLLFAMGTSALEGGLAFIPTALVDVCVTEALRYRYRWLNETRGYSLGYIVATDGDIPMEANKSMSQLLEQFNHDSSGIAERCHRYVVENHRLDLIGRVLQERLSRVSLDMGKMRELKLLGPRRFR